MITNTVITLKISSALTRYFYFFIFLLISKIIISQQGTWETVSIPTSGNLNHIHFVDSLTGWVVGDSGTIMFTEDGGISWNYQISNTVNDIITLFMVDSQYGWAATHNFTILPYGSEILKTSDGGLSWTVSNYPDEDVFIMTMFFHDTLSGWLGGTPHALVKTTDGGDSWHPASIDTTTLAFFPVLNINFYDSLVGFASGGIFDIAGVIWKTENGGNLWNAISVEYAPADEVHGLHIFNPLEIIGSGGDPDFGFGVGFMKSYNGGNSWVYDEIGIQGIAYDIDFVNENEGWAPLGPEQSLIYTLNRGNTWQQLPTPNSSEIFDITFTDKNHGYGVGRNCAFIRYNPEPVSVYEKSKPIEISIFPNPSQGITNITLHNMASQQGDLSLYIFSSQGKLIEEVKNGVSYDNTVRYKFDGSFLKNGVYKIVLKSNNNVLITDYLVFINY